MVSRYDVGLALMVAGLVFALFPALFSPGTLILAGCACILASSLRSPHA